MYNILERIENFNFSYDDDPEIIYLKECHLDNIVNRGLADLYSAQPINPINFLANWLLNEAKGIEMKKKIRENNIKKEENIVNFKKKKIKQDMIEKEKENEIKKNEDEKLAFFEKIKNCKNFDLYLNQICTDVQKYTKATGVYISIYDFKRKPVKINDDENSHLLNSKVLRYVGFCNDHIFLKNKNLEIKTGITYQLFEKIVKESKEKKEEDQQENENNPQIPQIEQNIPKNDLSDLNFIFVEEVVRNPKIKFFREPRLGSYLAIEMPINSSLSNLSLNSAIDKFINYSAKKKEYEERKAEFIKNAENEENKENKEKDVTIYKEILPIKSAMEKIQRVESVPKEKENLPEMLDPNNLNNNFPLNNFADNSNENIFKEEIILLEDYQTTEKKYVIGLDTLGQDKVFDEKDKKLIFEIVKTIKNSWEELEKFLLLKDRDLRMIQMEKENLAKSTQLMEKLEGEEDKYVKITFQDEKYSILEDPAEKSVLTELFKTRYIIESIKQEELFYELFNLLSQYEFIEYGKLVQHILYFVGFDNMSINEENTNKLDWNVAKKFWNDSILNSLLDYNPFGPRPAIDSYKMLNLTYNYIESLDKEALKNYNFILGRMADFIYGILSIRKNDIMKRREIINHKISERNELIKEKDLRDERRKIELEEYKKSFEGVEKNEENIFDEKAFLENWDNINKEILIPPPVEIDTDDDFYLVTQ